MNTHSINSESGLASGVKVVALALVLGFVAMASAPALVPGTHEATAAAVTPVVTQADYFPSHYPAPTATADPETPTF
jgi:hypothetical protein